MFIIKNMKKIEDYQLRELKEEKLFINKYSLDVKYDYEMKIFWKDFFFDMLQEMAQRDIVYLDKQVNLFQYLKENYNTIIKLWNLNIDKKDYIELTDYMTLDEWEDIMGNFLVQEGSDFYLISVEE